MRPFCSCARHEGFRNYQHELDQYLAHPLATTSSTRGQPHQVHRVLGSVSSNRTRAEHLADGAEMRVQGTAIPRNNPTSNYKHPKSQWHTAGLGHQDVTLRNCCYARPSVTEHAPPPCGPALAVKLPSVQCINLDLKNFELGLDDSEVRWRLQHQANTARACQHRRNTASTCFYMLLLLRRFLNELNGSSVHAREVSVTHNNMSPAVPHTLRDQREQDS